MRVRHLACLLAATALASCSPAAPKDVEQGPTQDSAETSQPAPAAPEQTPAAPAAAEVLSPRTAELRALSDVAMKDVPCWMEGTGGEVAACESEKRRRGLAPKVDGTFSPVPVGAQFSPQQR